MATSPTSETRQLENRSPLICISDEAAQLIAINQLHMDIFELLIGVSRLTEATGEMITGGAACQLDVADLQLSLEDSAKTAELLQQQLAQVAEQKNVIRARILHCLELKSKEVDAFRVRHADRWQEIEMMHSHESSAAKEDEKHGG